MCAYVSMLYDLYSLLFPLYFSKDLPCSYTQCPKVECIKCKLQLPVTEVREHQLVCSGAPSSRENLVRYYCTLHYQLPLKVIEHLVWHFIGICFLKHRCRLKPFVNHSTNQFLSTLFARFHDCLMTCSIHISSTLPNSWRLEFL